MKSIEEISLILARIDTLKVEFTENLNKFNKFKDEYSLINKYYEKLFEKSIYSEFIYDNNLQLMFLKIEQDIQFLYSLKVDKTIKVFENKRKELILNLMKDTKIEKLVEDFLSDSNIISEIQKIFEEFKDKLDMKEVGKSNIEIQNKENINKNEKTIHNIKYNELDDSDIKKEDEFWKKKDLKRIKNNIKEKEKEKLNESKKGVDKNIEWEDSKEKIGEILLNKIGQVEINKKKDLIEENDENKSEEKEEEKEEEKDEKFEEKQESKIEEKDESKNEKYEEKDTEEKKEEEKIEEGRKEKNNEFNLTPEEIKFYIKEKLVNEIFELFYIFFRKKIWKEINNFYLLSLSKQIIQKNK